MPTTLLLDGPDLEALLVRARREGGPNARITRAEKVRRGGVMGFFAREIFEVAVEVPDGYVPESQQAGQNTRTSQDGARPATGAGSAQAAGPMAGAGSAPGAPGAADGDPFDAVVRAIAAMGAADAANAAEADLGTGLGTSLGTDLGTDLGAGPGADLGALNAAGVSGTASRVRKAQRAATARAYSAGGYTAGGQVVGLAPSDDPTSAQFPGSTGSFAATALLDRLEGRDGDGPVHPVPHESPLDPTNPSTEQPAFTTLLDQLRREALDPSSQDVSGSSPDGPQSLDDAQNLHGAGRGTAAVGFAPLVPAQAKASPGLVAQPAAPDSNRADSNRADSNRADSNRADSNRADSNRADSNTADLYGAGPVSAESVEVTDLPDTGLPDTGRQPTEAGRDSARSTSRRPVDPQLKADRAVLRTLGVPVALTRKLRAGDRFTAVRQMLSRLPVLDVDPDAPVVAVVGPDALVMLEAHRVAVDLATGTQPRPILALPSDDARQRRSVVEAGRRLDSVVVALPAEPGGTTSGGQVRKDLRDLRAQVVVAVVDARHPVEQTRQWLSSVGRVDALAVEHAGDVTDPARVLELGIPVVRVDGVGMDALGWTAMLCARLADADRATARAGRTGDTGRGTTRRSARRGTEEA